MIKVSSFKEMFAEVGIPPDRALHYEQLMTSNDIEIHMFQELNHSILKEIGISSVGNMLHMSLKCSVHVQETE
jgi:hypothetical protein